MIDDAHARVRVDDPGRAVPDRARLPADHGRADLSSCSTASSARTSTTWRPAATSTSGSTCSGSSAIPRCYILILPAFGIVSEVLPTFARKPLFGAPGRHLLRRADRLLRLRRLEPSHVRDRHGPGGRLRRSRSPRCSSRSRPGVKIFNWLATLWGGSIRATTRAALRGRPGRALHHRRPLGRHARLAAGRPAADRQLLRRRAPPLRADRRQPLRALRGHLLLVAEDDGPPARRGAGPAQLLADVRGLQPRVLSTALPRRAGDAAPHLHLSAPTRAGPPPTSPRRSARSASRWPCSSSWSTPGAASAVARRHPRIPGTGARSSGGPRRRRRRTTSTRSRRSTAATRSGARSTVPVARPPPALASAEARRRRARGDSPACAVALAAADRARDADRGGRRPDPRRARRGRHPLDRSGRSSAWRSSITGRRSTRTRQGVLGLDHRKMAMWVFLGSGVLLLRHARRDLPRVQGPERRRARRRTRSSTSRRRRCLDLRPPDVEPAHGAGARRRPARRPAAGAALALRHRVLRPDLPRLPGVRVHRVRPRGLHAPAELCSARRSSCSPAFTARTWRSACCWLLSLWVLALRGRLGAADAVKVEIAGLYWHFVDVVWIAIFTLVYLIP